MILWGWTSKEALEVPKPPSEPRFHGDDPKKWFDCSPFGNGTTHRLTREEKQNDHSFRILEMQAKSTHCDKFCTSCARAGLHLQTTSQPTLLTVSEPGSYTRVYALHIPYIASTRIVTTCQTTTARLSSTVLLYTEKLITSCTITNTHNGPSFRHDLPQVCAPAPSPQRFAFISSPNGRDKFDLHLSGPRQKDRADSPGGLEGCMERSACCM